MREGGRPNRAQSDINQYMQHFLTTSSNKDDIVNTGGDEQLMSVDRRNIIRVTSDGDSNTGGLY
jgi:hypothetical protein